MGWFVRILLIAWMGPGLSLPSLAYPTPVDFDGSLLRWDVSDTDPPITYEIKADRDEDEALYGGAVDDAAALWNDVPTSYFAFAPVAEGGTAQVTVHLESALDGAPYSAGYAIFDEYDGATPSHCSIHVSVGAGDSYQSIAKTLLHELGHCAGLGHSLIPEAIMGYQLSKNGFALDIDDEAAITRLYPTDGSEPKLPPGCSVGAGAERGVPLLLLCLLGSPLMLAAPSLRARRSPSRCWP